MPSLHSLHFSCHRSFRCASRVITPFAALLVPSLHSLLFSCHHSIRCTSRAITPFAALLVQPSSRRLPRHRHCHRHRHHHPYLVHCLCGSSSRRDAVRRAISSPTPNSLSPPLLSTCRRTCWWRSFRWIDGNWFTEVPPDITNIATITVL
jgi:hypothetical protein